MNFYLKYMSNVCKQGLVYRFDYIMKIIGSITSFLVQYYIWKALMLTPQDSVDQTYIVFEQVITYITISAVIKSFMKSGTTKEVNEKIRSGSLAMDLIRPYNFMGMTFCSKLAKIFYQFVFLSLPLLVFSILFFKIKFASIFNIFCGIISIIGGIIIMFLLEYILGLLSFWFQQTWMLERLLNDIIRFMSGSVLPIWVFPNSIQTILKYFPFQYIYYKPITMITFGYNSQQMAELYFLQLLWIIGLFIISILLWKKSVRRITIQGG